MFLDALHEIIQSMFGWTDAHLHRFGSDPDIFSSETEHFLCPFDVNEGQQGAAEQDVRLDEVLAAVGDQLHYVYDFGDDWRHCIKLEAVERRDANAPRAVCTGGERPGPHEGCGGVEGYELVAAAGDHNHEQHTAALTELAHRLGGYAQAFRLKTVPFDIALVNHELANVTGERTPPRDELAAPVAGLLDAVRSPRAQRTFRGLIADPPPLDTTPVNPGSVASECAAAAMRMVDRVNGVLITAATEPIPLLKSGNVGVRAVRNLTKSMGATVEEARLAVELACAAGLLLPAEPPAAEPARTRGRKGRSQRAEPPPAPKGLVPTEEAAQWRAERSSGRLGRLIKTWWKLNEAPLADDKAIRAVLDNEPSEAFTDIRSRTIELVCTLDGNSAVTGGLAELLSWQVPMLTPALVGPLVDATLAEAELLGVVDAGAPGELAPTLRSGASTVEDPELTKTTDTLVASARTSALFGNDLTAIVTGSADTELSSILDTAADREAQGSASTWRFSPASVRRAFDNGVTAEGLLERLGGVAQGELPQPLVYLIKDVARRHGQLGVIDVRCVLVGDDAALLTEVAAHHKLTGLGLAQLAPTVLASHATASDTLAALREAGYAPVPRGPDGSIVVTREQSAPQAAQTEEPGVIMMIDGKLVELDDLGELPSLPGADPAEHAARLVESVAEPTQRVTRRDLLEYLHRKGERYRGPEWSNLAWRLEFHGATVNYHKPDGDVVTLHISNPEWYGDALNVWSTQDDDYRTLDLTRITPT